jgi:zinc protease
LLSPLLRAAVSPAVILALALPSAAPAQSPAPAASPAPATSPVPIAVPQASTDVTRATLDNGLRVVIVRDPLAPVATVYDNYLVGANETPAGFPGMAHAQEHMAFRGCSGVTADQTSAIFAQLGGDGDADTQQTITQYFSSVPAADLDIALHVDAACMRDIDDSDAQWKQERGAIEQEVAQDNSNPQYKAVTRIFADMFAGTPYAHDPLGTRPSFDKTTGALLKQFYRSWYAPNNAILVIAGDVDPQKTLSTVKELYGSIPSHALPARPAVDLQPVKPESFSLDSDLPYVLS